MSMSERPSPREETIVAECSGDAYDLSTACVPERPQDPCSIVILGGSGDPDRPEAGTGSFFICF